MGLYLSGAKFRPISYRADAGKFTATPLGYIVHVPVGNGSLFNYFNGLKSPARKFCTAWIAKDGSAEQYTTLDMKSWAQADGNGLYWSFEVEGFPGEPMTDAQLATLARWHKELGVADAIATAPGQKGIGTHQMGGAAWGGHSCPGAVRTAQLPQIIVRANQGDDMSAQDVQQINDYTAALLLNGYTAGGKAQPSLLAILVETQKRVTNQGAQITALSAAVQSLAQSKGVDPVEVQAAVTAALDKYTLTLSKGA